jgi:O-methyltransferase
MTGLLNNKSAALLKQMMDEGRHDEVLDFGTKYRDEIFAFVDRVNSGKVDLPEPARTEMLKKLQRSAKETRLLQINILYTRAVMAKDVAGARTLYHELIDLVPKHRLPSDALEERYFMGLFKTRVSFKPFARKARHLILIEQLRTVLDLSGDIAECGCYRGLSSYTICQTLNEEGGGFDGTGHHIFDSFAGLSTPTPEDDIAPSDPKKSDLAAMMHPGYFACPMEHVQFHLSDFPGIAYHPGWLPESLADVPERSYRFVHLDVDLYEPTAGSLEYFYPRLVPGGIILTDDYGWPGARRAFDEFCAANKIAFDTFPTQQAVLRKH